MKLPGIIIRIGLTCVRSQLKHHKSCIFTEFLQEAHCLTLNLFLCETYVWQANRFGAQTAQQLVRQHIDHGGVFDPETHQWREIHDVTYLSSYNPQTPPTTARLNRRLLRHFALFSVTFPRWGTQNQVYNVSVRDWGFKMVFYCKFEATVIASLKELSWCIKSIVV